MPRGDRYHIPSPAWTKGPKKTINALNADSKILSDLADRVADLEQEADVGGVAGGVITTIICPDGVATYAVVQGELGAVVT